MLFHLHLLHVNEWVSLLRGARLHQYPLPYRCEHRLAGETSAPQVDGLGIGGLAAPRPDRWEIMYLARSCNQQTLAPFGTSVGEHASFCRAG